MRNAELGARGALPPLIAGLLRPEAYPHPTGPISLIQTHISYVLLTGPFVYKIKKPVSFGFLDYSSLALRRFFCHEEIRLNSRLCPELYLGVVPIGQANGAWRVGVDSPPAEHAVKMVQLPSERMMDVLLSSGGVTPADMERLAARLARFYASVATGYSVDQHGMLETIRFNAEENFSQTAPFVGRTVTAEQQHMAAEYTREFLARRAGLFAARVAHGRIRDGHGDLRPSSICLAAKLSIFDCLEFSARLRCCDVAADVAFLAMELDHAGRCDLERRFVQSFVQHSRDEGLLELLPFYKLYRAWVRGKVESLKLDELEVPTEERQRGADLAHSYFTLAAGYAAGDVRPSLLLLSGPAQRGRTALASSLSALLGWGLISHDENGFGAGSCSDQSAWRAALERARKLLTAGESVLLDSALIASEEFEGIRAMAVEADARLCVVECYDRDQPEQGMTSLERAMPALRSSGRGRSPLSPAILWVDVSDPAPETARQVIAQLQADWGRTASC
ncbi:MAG: hypothetical protein EPO21_22570 [Chloroflexota bacterium]|nr:MAG: hypothetical protein EPO21_22570 [Chloroflexota bacterium]